MRGGGVNVTTYNTAIRDNGALPTDDFVLITYIYNGDTSSFDLYFGGKYYGICPMFINQAQTNQLTVTPWCVGGFSGTYFAKCELTSLIISKHIFREPSFQILSSHRHAAAHFFGLRSSPHRLFLFGPRLLLRRGSPTRIFPRHYVFY